MIFPTKEEVFFLVFVFCNVCNGHTSFLSLTPPLILCKVWFRNWVETHSFCGLLIETMLQQFELF